MEQTSTFDQLLDAIDHLPDEQQANLVDVVRRRLAERGRQRILNDVKEAKAEHAEGKSRAMSVDEFMREILS